MCFHPVKILNPSRSYRSDVPKYLYVPCGHCQDCQRVKHNEWFFRAMIEWNYYRSIGGAVYFITLTYNDDDLPTHTLTSGVTIKCFDKRHIHNFIKYLRIFLARSHFEHKGIKYLICSEYSDKNTKRPHYHGLLFFPYHIPCIGQKSLFTRLMQTCWQHGFIVCSEFGWELNSAKAIRYATKYVCKDIGFYNEFVRDYLDCKDVEQRNVRKKELSPYLPRHWQSVGFGSPFLDIIKSQKSISAFLFRDKYRLNIDKSADFRLPRYYHLKFEKAVAKDLSLLLDKVVQVTTPVGKNVRLMRLNKMLDDSVIRLLDMSDSINLDSIFPSEEVYYDALAWYKKFYPTQYYIFSLSEKGYNFMRSITIDYIAKSIHKFDLRKLALYQIFLRHFPLFDDDVPEDMFSRVPDIMHNMVDSPNVPPEIVELGLCSNADYVATPLKENEDARKQNVCQNNKYFLQYENLSRSMDILTDIRNICRDYSAFYKKEKKDSVRAWKPNKIKTFSSNDCIS